MAQMISNREYDVVLFGATGYTGQYTAEHITAHFPTTFNWAVAGRSHDKVAGIVKNLKKLNVDRKEPSIEVAQLNKDDLKTLARKTRVLINTVGPYCLHGKLVVEACAESGTHYLDVTGETPWVYDMIEQYHEKARATGAIIIPQCGVESVPADILTYSLARHLRKTVSVPTLEVIHSLHAIKSKPSGGTLATVMALFDVYSLSTIARGTSSSGLCPIPLPKSQTKAGVLSNLTGVRSVGGLGTLTTSLQKSADLPYVNRSWGLLEAGPTSKEESYGPNFQFNPYMRTRNSFIGFLVHIAMTISPLFLVFPPVRWLLAKLVYQPGQGASRKETENDYLEYRAIAIADSPARQRAFSSLVWRGSAYHLTGVTLAEGAATLLKSDSITAKKMGGGILTAATMGQAYIDRLVNAGVVIETKTLSE